MTSTTLLLCGFVAAFCVGLRFDLKRRKLSRREAPGWTLLTLLDVVCLNSIFGIAAILILAATNPTGSARLLSPPTFGVVCCGVALLFLWAEGRRQVQLQRPAGIVAAESALLLGLSLAFIFWLFHQSFVRFPVLRGIVVPLVVGAVLLAIVLPPICEGARRASDSRSHCRAGRIRTDGMGWLDSGMPVS